MGFSLHRPYRAAVCECREEGVGRVPRAHRKTGSLRGRFNWAPSGGLNGGSTVGF